MLEVLISMLAKPKIDIMREKEMLIENMIFHENLKDKRVIEAFRKIPRENFFASETKKRKDFAAIVYSDYAYPIYENQTISQPSTIAQMLELLEIKENHKVLEIGTGSGYNAALLSKLAKFVYTIETIPKLVKFAVENLERIKIRNVKVIQGDGSRGYEKEAPYDRIIAACACDEIPEAWKEQLKDNGIIVAPVGANLSCEMVAATKINGKFSYSKRGMFSFVPMVKD